MNVASGLGSVTLTTAVQPGDQRRSDLLRHGREGEVVGREGGDDADRLLDDQARAGHRDDAAALGARRQRAEVAEPHLGGVEAAADLGVVVEAHHRGDDLVDLREEQRAAELLGDQLGELLLALGDRVGHPGQVVGPLGRGQPRPLPLVEGPAGRGDGVVDVGRGGGRDVPDDLLGPRGDDVEPVVGLGGTPGAVDEERLVIDGCHGLTLHSLTGRGGPDAVLKPN